MLRMRKWQLLSILNAQVKYVLLSVLSNVDGGGGDKFDQHRLRRLQGGGKPLQQPPAAIIFLNLTFLAGKRNIYDTC